MPAGATQASPFKHLRLDEPGLAAGASLAIVRELDEEEAPLSTPEQKYQSAVPLQRRKRLGQFFTPESTARLMADWIAPVAPISILDPAVGVGIFPRVLLKSCPHARLTCLDIDPDAIHAARQSLGSHALNSRFVQHDFLTWQEDQLFDAAIANPPYLRRRDINYPFDIFHSVGERNGVMLSRLSNVYVLFLLEICRRLRPGGRAAVLVPGEWINANFGSSLKRWLLSRGLLHTLLYFSDGYSQFEEALTTASILLLEKPQEHQSRATVRTIVASAHCSTHALHHALFSDSNDVDLTIEQFPVESLAREQKWSHVFTQKTFPGADGLIRLGEIATTRRGIATGCNSFFHLRPASAQTLGIRPQNLVACVGRAADVAGLIYTPSDHTQLAADNRPCLLFDLRSQPSIAEAEYIRTGEAAGVHRRFLCQARSRWYTMEQVSPSPIWAATFGRSGLKFIHNTAGVANLTAFHCIYPRVNDPLFVRALTACLNSQVVQQSARQQQRIYGGGLLKIEPRDLLEIKVPDLRRASRKLLESLASLLPRLDQSKRTDYEIGKVHKELEETVESLVPHAHEAVQA